MRSSLRSSAESKERIFIPETAGAVTTAENRETDTAATSRIRTKVGTLYAHKK